MGNKWTTEKLKKAYVDFFVKRKHVEIANASLVPENDPTVLFTTAGMHPLVPFLLGEPHACGKRLVNVQKCIRTGDIDEVGDEGHLTFFEMLGNWSLGDYFKEESIKLSFEFLTSVLGFDKNKIYVSCFEGDKDVPKDEESAKIWEDLGISKERIFYLGREDNWWGPAGKTGPCGPDTEIFIDDGREKCSSKCKPGCNCGKYTEVWNNVFMEFNKLEDGSYVSLEQKNVDTGMGVERTVALLNKLNNIYEIEVFKKAFEEVKKLSKSPDEVGCRIIVDHLTASVFIIGDERGILPSNLDQGYVLRKLIRRAIRKGKVMGVEGNFCSKIADIILGLRKKEYPEVYKKRKFILDSLEEEEEKFTKALEKGIKEFEKIKGKKISGKQAFILFSSYCVPLEMIEELAKTKGMKVDVKGFEEEFSKHRELSKTDKKFKSGLADDSEMTRKLHTATHLLHAALKKVLSKDVNQRGSNITSERLRFDFSLDRKLTFEEIKKVEDLINEWISKGLCIKREKMNVSEAKKKGAVGLFSQKYGEKVSVYSVEGVSKEICAGPHVENTSCLGKFKIVKESSVASGVRRIKAVLV